MLARLRSWLGAVLKRHSFEDRMNHEMRFHLESLTDDLIGHVFLARKPSVAREWSSVELLRLMAGLAANENVAERIRQLS